MAIPHYLEWFPQDIFFQASASKLSCLELGRLCSSAAQSHEPMVAASPRDRAFQDDEGRWQPLASDGCVEVSLSG